MNNGKKIDLVSLVILCYILDDYEQFANNFKSFISHSGYTVDWGLLENLGKISTGKKVIGYNKLKRFYQDNKHAVDIIYDAILPIDGIRFIGFNLNNNGCVSETSDIDYFYHYLQDHKADLNKILSVLIKLSGLGFNKISLDETNDFSNSEYQFIIPNVSSKYIYYLENMQGIPCYSNKEIKYKSTGSNYLISALAYAGSNSVYGRKIILNNLAFMPSQLPDELSSTYLSESILALKVNNQDLRSEVDIEMSLDEMDKQVKHLNQVLNDSTLTDELKHNILEQLECIKERLNNLRTLQTESYAQGISNDGYNREELVEKEKNILLRRRTIDSPIDTTYLDINY